MLPSDKAQIFKIIREINVEMNDYNKKNVGLLYFIFYFFDFE
jgi:hypothetical protein